MPRVGTKVETALHSVEGDIKHDNGLKDSKRYSFVVISFGKLFLKPRQKRSSQRRNCVVLNCILPYELIVNT